MKIIISPAKKMKIEEFIQDRNTPIFIHETVKIYQSLAKLSLEELKRVYCTSDKIALKEYKALKSLSFDSIKSPAIFSYDGIQYTYMGVSSFTDEMLEYLDEHVRIISAFYGLLSPFEGVVQYRLELQAKLSVDGNSDMYEFWGSKIYDALNDDFIINLASKEYSKVVEPYLKKSDRFITPIFAEIIDGKITTKGVYAKMCRGEMVRYICENRVDSIEGLKNFTSCIGYKYNDELSNDRFIYYTK